VTLGAYLSAVRDLGSPAFTPGEIAGEPVALQQMADAMLIDAERIDGLPAGTRPPAGASCSRLVLTAPARMLTVSVDPGHSVYVAAAPGATVSLWLRRLSASFPTPPLQTVGPGASVRFDLPRDSSSIPWRLQVRTPDPPRADARSLKAPRALATICVSATGT
jgi:hypothetical protein